MARRRYGRRSSHGYGGWAPYVPVAERRAQARRLAKSLAKKGQELTPVEVEGRKITRTFWGDAWCRNLERYSDFANRLPRGRTYVRNGSVIHLGIAKGKINALVSGSDVYEVEIDITRTAKKEWKSLCRDCTGQIDSVVDLLRGQLSEGVMERICRPKTGLFPAPRQIRLSCSCPDWADMCKHVAAVLYGVGCRLDAEPELLFRLRGVDEGEMIAEAAGRVSETARTKAPRNVLEDDGGLDEIFGIDLGGAQAAPPAKAPRRKRAAKKKVAKKKTVQRKKATKRKPAGKKKATPGKRKVKPKAKAKTKTKTKAKAKTKAKTTARKKKAAPVKKAAPKKKARAKKKPR